MGIGILVPVIQTNYDSKSHLGTKKVLLVVRNSVLTGYLLMSCHCIKGVLHTRPVFGLFLHFSQKLQHIGNK